MQNPQELQGHLVGLNEQQVDAVLCNAGLVYVEAGPGTGKTHILYKQSEDIVTDSVRFHYRKQGDKMVLVKKEIL